MTDDNEIGERVDAEGAAKPGALRDAIRANLDSETQEEYLRQFFDEPTTVLDAELSMTRPQAERLIQWIAEKAQGVRSRTLEQDRQNRLARLNETARDMALDSARSGFGFGSLLSGWFLAHVALGETIDHASVADAVEVASGAEQRRLYELQVEQFEKAVKAGSAARMVNVIGDPLLLLLPGRDSTTH